MVARSSSSGQLRGRQPAEDSERDPGIPKFYFLRTGGPIGGPIQKVQPKERSLRRSNSAASSVVSTPTGGGRSLRGLGDSLLRAPPATSLTRLAEDLAPPDVVDPKADEPLPPGIVECRSKLEAFRSAAVDAISLEALLSIENKRQALPAALQNQQHDVSRTMRRGMPQAAEASQLRQGYDPKVQSANMLEDEGPPPGVDEVKRKLAEFQAEVARASRAEALLGAH